MADIRPFRGAHYNRRLINDLSAVICPPYDIITPQMEPELYSRSGYNFIRLEAGRELTQDTATDNKYSRSAATMEQWLKQGILEIYEVPAIYLHDHYFSYQGKEYRRRGIIARVRLEEWDKMVVRPHEGTLSKPKDDRLSLLWALQANTSSILTMFEDERQLLSLLLAKQEQTQPLIHSNMDIGERHDVWAITEPEVVNQICRHLSHQPLYIADGHHRYESALTYQREKRAYSTSTSGDEPFNYVMMTLVAFSDPGLLTLPPHRLIRGISKSTLDELMAKLRLLFEVEELPLSMPGIWQRVENLLTATNLSETNRIVLILFGLAAENMLILKPRDLAVVSSMMPYFHCELYKRLGVSIVDHIVLEKLIGLSSESDKASLDYSYDKRDAVDRVLNQEYQLAILLSPINVAVIKAIADAGDRMPHKSTYFYPKLPSGLVFNVLR